MTDRAVSSAVAAAIEDEDEPEQLGLFGPPLTDAGQHHPRNQRRGPGRPPGALNRRTERTVAWLLSRHRDPREVLLEIAESNIFDLAALLGCKPFEALQEKRLAAAAVLPYVAARITPEVIDQRQVIHLTLNTGEAAVAGDGGRPGDNAIRVLDASEFEALPAPSADGSSAATTDEPSD